MRTLDGAAACPAEKCVYAKRRSNKCPRVTTQSTLPGLLSYMNYVYYNTLIDSFRDTRPISFAYVKSVMHRST